MFRRMFYLLWCLILLIQPESYASFSDNDFKVSQLSLKRNMRLHKNLQDTIYLSRRDTTDNLVLEKDSLPSAKFFAGSDSLKQAISFLDQLISQDSLAELNELQQVQLRSLIEYARMQPVKKRIDSIKKRFLVDSSVIEVREITLTSFDTTYLFIQDTILIEQEDSAVFDEDGVLTDSIPRHLRDSLSSDSISKDPDYQGLNTDTTTMKRDSIRQDAAVRTSERKPQGKSAGTSDDVLKDTLEEAETNRLVRKDSIKMGKSNQLTGKDTLQNARTDHRNRKDTIPEDDTGQFVRKDTIKVEEADSELHDSLDLSAGQKKKDTLIRRKIPEQKKKIVYLRDSMIIDRQDTLITRIDSSIYFRNDSLVQALRVLQNYLEYDSVLLGIQNSTGNFTRLWLKRNLRDSTRFRLYDKNDVPGGIWIKSLNDTSIQMHFDNTTLLDKPEKRYVIERYVPVERNKATDIVKPHERNIIIGIWKFSGKANLNFSQGYYSKNWVKSGQGNISTLSRIRLDANYIKGDMSWDNNLEYKHGLIKTEGTSIRTNEDRLVINSKFGLKALNDWYYSSLLNFESQFFRGYNYPNDSIPVSKIFSPAKAVFSIGMDYKPSNDLTILFSPISSKFTIVADTATILDHKKYGLSENEKVKKEIGAYLKSRFELDITEDIHLQNKINFFANYMASRENKDAGWLNQVDIDWEVTLNMKISEYINTTINANLIKDLDEDKKVQFKETLSVGFYYWF